MTVTLTSKGRVTIPKRIRDHLGITAGARVDFELAPDGRVVLVTLEGRPSRSRFEALRGTAGPGLSTDEIMALTRAD